MAIKFIQKWIDYLSCPQDLLNGLAICPFAKKAKFQFIKSHSTKIIPPEDNFEIIIYKIENDITFNRLFDICKQLNQKYPHLVFLPDHRDRRTYINNKKTNNGKFNLVLCQHREQLNKAREMLRDTNYYSFWNEKYLKEITDM